MYILLAFGITLLIAVYLSGLAERSPVSTSVLFLAAGFIIGPGALNLIQPQPDDAWIREFVEVALVAVLFSDGMNIDMNSFRSVWKLAGRALFIGLPITLAVMAILAKLMAGVSWSQAFLIGAVLSPTDPVFASMVVRQPAVPQRLRRMLNVESGVNDGLALPFILTGLALLNREEFQPLAWAGELAFGIVLGVGVCWLAFKIKEFLHINAAGSYRPLMGLAIGLVVFALAKLLHANPFLASFSAGITAVTVAPHHSRRYLELGEQISEVLKLAGLLVFGSLLSISFFSGITPIHLLFAILVLIIARPVGLIISMAKSPLTWKERFVVG